MAHILVVDDDREVLTTLRDALLVVGHTVTIAENGREALAFFQRTPFDIAVIDVDMPLMNGFELTREIKKHQPRFPVILITGFSHLYNAAEVLTLDVEAFLQKPIHILNLTRIIKSITNQGRS